MRRFMLAVFLVVAVVAPAHAQVQVSIGISLPGPPTLAVIPGAPVYYAPRAPANVFFYADQYWLFHTNGWHAGPSWNGPWVVVDPVVRAGAGPARARAVLRGATAPLEELAGRRAATMGRALGARMARGRS